MRVYLFSLLNKVKKLRPIQFVLFSCNLSRGVYIVFERLFVMFKS